MAKRDYPHYTLEDFVFDDEFRQWVRQADVRQDKHWQRVGQQHPHLLPLMERARALVSQLRVQEDAMPDESQQRIWQQLDQRLVTTAPDPHVRPLYPNRRRIVLVAASVALVLLAGWWYWLRDPTEQIRTAYGETRQIELPDGSIVRLNGNSALTYKRHWPSGAAREVWLTGEAFFTVTKRSNDDGRVKFITHTPRLDITVLGTQFNVRTRHNNTSVTLIEGRIQLDSRDRKTSRIIELRPGQQARLQSGLPLQVEAVRTEVHDAWTRNQFVFDNTPLSEIRDMLQETYGLRLTFPEGFADKRFTANLSNQNLETLLTVIAETYNLTVDRLDRQVVFRKK